MKQRLDYISILRVGAMSSVVVYHCICGYSNIWGGKWSWQIVDFWNTIAHVLSYYHMPLFVIISGFLFKYVQITGKYSNFGTFLYKKIRRIMIPYIVWGCLLYMIWGSSVGRLQDGYMHLWFLWFIFQAYVTFYYMDKFVGNNKFAEICLFVCSIFAIILFEKCKNEIGYWEFGIHSYLQYMPYYIVGAQLYRYMLSRSLNLNICKIGLSSCVIGFVMCYRFFFKYTLAVLFALFVLLFGICVMSRLTFKSYGWIKMFDKYSLSIYILHHPMIQLMNDSKIGVMYMPHYWIYPIVQFCMVILLSLFITEMLAKYKIGKVVLGL